MKTLMTCLMLVSSVLFSVDTAQAINMWDGGGGDTSWNTAANWDLDSLPSFVGTENVTMQTFTSGFSTTLDGNKSINSLTISATQPLGTDIVRIDPGAPGTSFLTLASGNLTRTGGTSGRTAIIGADILLGATGTWSMITAQSTTQVDGAISDGGNTYGINVSGSNRSLVLNGVNTFDGDLNITNTSVRILNDNSARAGNTTLNSGGLDLEHNDALGSGKLIINGGSISAFEPVGVILDNDLDLNVASLTYRDDITFTASSSFQPLFQDVTLQGSSGGSFLLFQNNLTDNGGNFGITKGGGSSSGTLELSGTNTFGGDIRVTAGTLRLSGDNTGVAGDTIVQSSSQSIGIDLQSDDALSAGKFIISNGGAAISLQDNSSVIAQVFSNALEWGGTIGMDMENLRFTGDLLITDDLVFQTGPANGILQFAGDISDGGNDYGIHLNPESTRSGRLVLEGNNTFTGTLEASGGSAARIELNGATLSSSDIVIGSSGQFFGTGTVIFSDDDIIDVDGIMTASSMLFDLTALSNFEVTLVDYSGGTFNGPGTLDDLLTANSLAMGWFLTDTGTQILAEAPVPEPSSLILLSIGMGMMTIRRRRRFQGAKRS